MLDTIFMLLFISALIASIVLAFKRQGKKFLIAFGIALLSFVGFGLTTTPEAVTLALDQSAVQSNDQGMVLIAGQTNRQADITIDGEDVLVTKEGHFEHEVQLTEDKDRNVTVVATYSQKKRSEKVALTPSSGFKRYLGESEQAEAEALALELAEAAVKLAETSLKKTDYDEALALVSALETKDEPLNQRLKKIDLDMKVAAEETANQQAAEDALIAAETSPTKETLAQAKSAVALITSDKAPFDTRLAAVNKTVVAAEEQKQKAAQLASQQEAAADLPDTQGQNNQTSMMVLTTPTGKKYHSYKCGNGTYTENTLANAEAQGLTPCAKCF